MPARKVQAYQKLNSDLRYAADKAGDDICTLWVTLWSAGSGEPVSTLWYWVNTFEHGEFLYCI